MVPVPVPAKYCKVHSFIKYKNKCNGGVFSSRALIDLTADEAVTDLVLTQQVAEESYTASYSSMPSPVAPPYSPPALFVC